MQSRSFLGQTTVSNLRETELTFDYPKRILDLRAYSSFDALRCIKQLPRGRFQIQRSALSGDHRNVLVHVKTLYLFALFYTAIARIYEYVGLLAVQKVLSLGDVMRIGGCCHRVVHQCGFCVDSDVGLNSKVVLDFLLRLVHLRIARTTLILGRTGRRNQRCVNRGPASEQDSLGLEGCVDFGQNDLGQTKIREEMLKPQNYGFVWQAGGTGA